MTQNSSVAELSLTIVVPCAGSSRLQVPAVVVAAPSAAQEGTGPGPLPKQISQPELGGEAKVYWPRHIHILSELLKLVEPALC